MAYAIQTLHKASVKTKLLSQYTDSGYAKDQLQCVQLSTANTCFFTVAACCAMQFSPITIIFLFAELLLERL